MNSEPLLLRVARLCVGITEVPGPKKSNPVHIEWAKALGVGAIYTDDDIAWCALAMNRWCLTCEYPLSGRSYDILRAKSFETWGVALATPALGALGVFSRPSGHHVGLYLGERKNAYRLIGANQRNAVTDDAWLERDRLVGWRWPVGVSLPTTGRIHLADDGKPLSTNEA